jgi:hypothetical protein
MAISLVARKLGIALGCSLIGWWAVATAADRPAIRLVNGTPLAWEAMGLGQEELAALAQLPGDDPKFVERFSVSVVGDGQDQPPPMAGKYEVLGDILRFTPQFAMRPGVHYQVKLVPRISGVDLPPIFVRFVIPLPPPGKPTKVTAIYPSAAVLPENQLRFYLYFSAPMRQGEAYSHLKLLKANGQPVERAFLEIGEELWDPTGTRLTLLFDPGRVKQGLQPREEFGPVLVAGEKYVLRIDKRWRDAAGQALAEEFEKRFTAGPMIDAAVDHKQWKTAPPAAGTRDPLVVRFPRPLDRALLAWAITIENAVGQEVAGEVAVADEERQWEFRPEQPWESGKFSLVVDTTLEDSAGNNLARPFEVDVFREIQERVVAEYARLPVEIRAK